MTDFLRDMEVIYRSYPPEVRQGDRQAHRLTASRGTLLTTFILLLIIVPSLLLVAAPWWFIPIAQPIICGLLYLHWYDQTEEIILYREADRRHLRYDRSATPLHQLMNRINADYNRKTSSESFTWI